MYTAYYQSPLGFVKITASDHGIVSVHLCDHAAKDSTKRVPVLEQCLGQVEEYFHGQRRHFSLKLDRQGTEFQRKVWEALDAIPFGQTVSYQYISQKIGSPKAVRAVGAAIGKNPHWIVTPCHRVIGKYGAATGYAGGLDRKMWLLEFERKISQA